MFDSSIWNTTISEYFNWKYMVMKSSVSAIFVLAAAATGAYALDFTGVSSGRTDLSTAENIRLITTPETEGGAERTNFRASGITANSVTSVNEQATDGKGNVNIASSMGLSQTFLIDAKSDVEKTVIDVASWRQNYINTKITNSTSKDALISVNFGSGLTESSFGQEQYMTFENITANVSAASSMLDQGDSRLIFGANSKVNWTGHMTATGTGQLIFQSGSRTSFTVASNSTTTVKKSAKMLVNQGAVVNMNQMSLGIWNEDCDSLLQIDGQLNMGDKITTYRGTTVNIGATGSVFSSNKGLQIGTNSTLNVDGNLFMGGGSWFTLYGTANFNQTDPSRQMVFYSITGNGNLTQAEAKVTDANKGNVGIKIKRAATLGSSAVWIIDERVDLEGNIVSGTDADVTTAKLIITSNAKLKIRGSADRVARVIMWDMAKMYLKNENSITDLDGNAVKLVTAAGAKQLPELHLEAAQKFSMLSLSSDLSIYLDSSAAKLELTGKETTIDMGTDVILSIYNFENERIYVGENENTLKNLGNIKAYDSEKNLLEISVVNGWLSTVPEPSTYAAIFGAIALAFAAYRRRK